MNHLSRLVEYLVWADVRVLDSLRNCRTALPAAQSLHAHVLGAEHVWLARITGAEPVVAIWPELTIVQCEVLASENAARLRDLVGSIVASDLDRPVTYRNSAGIEFTTALEDILLHVSAHGSYHRGQVAAMIRSAGEEPAPTDYIVWVRSGPARLGAPG